MSERIWITSHVERLRAAQCLLLAAMWGRTPLMPVVTAESEDAA